MCNCMQPTGSSEVAGWLDPLPRFFQVAGCITGIPCKISESNTHSAHLMITRHLSTFLWTRVQAISCASLNYTRAVATHNADLEQRETVWLYFSNAASSYILLNQRGQGAQHWKPTLLAFRSDRC